MKKIKFVITALLFLFLFVGCYNPFESLTDDRVELTVKNDLYAGYQITYVDLYVDGDFKATLETNEKKKYKLDKGSHTIAINTFRSSGAYHSSKSKSISLNGNKTIYIYNEFYDK